MGTPSDSSRAVLAARLRLALRRATGAFVDTDAVLAERASAAAQTGHAYMIRLRSGELVSIPQADAHVITTGTPVLIKFGADARVIPQNSSIGYL